MGRLHAFREHITFTDHLGSTRLILDGSNGNIMEKMTYTPMGRKWTATGSGSGSPSAGPILATNRYRYNGKEEQALPAGLPYTDYGARFFDSDAYIWLTPDPLSSKYPGINPYAFCAGDPVNFFKGWLHIPLFKIGNVYSKESIK